MSTARDTAERSHAGGDLAWKWNARWIAMSGEVDGACDGARSARSFRKEGASERHDAGEAHLCDRSGRLAHGLPPLGFPKHVAARELGRRKKKRRWAVGEPREDGGAQEREEKLGQ